MFAKELKSAWTFNSAKSKIPDLEKYTNKDEFKTWRFIQLAKEVHGDGTYDYSKVVAGNKEDKVIIICKAHGEFLQSTKDHITRGAGCKLCANKMTRSEFIRRAKEVHGGEYLYDSVEDPLPRTIDKATITCRVHGEFQQEISSHLKGHKCAKCSNRALKNTEKFIEQGLSVHGDQFDYSSAVYIGNKEYTRVTCKVCGNTSEVLPNNHLRGHGCRHCATSASKAEQEIRDFIESLGFTTEKIILDNGKHIDIFVPEISLGVEYNGSYWHSSVHKDKNYHLEKTEVANRQGIDLVHIWESDFVRDKGLVFSMISSKLGTLHRVYARDCVVKEVPIADARKFTENNHIQGHAQSATRHIGLYFYDTLVMLISLGKPRFNNKYSADLELLRSVAKQGVNVVGGLSKLLSKLPKNTKVISYARRDYSNGNSYIKTGFTLIGTTPVDYWYVNSKGDHISRYQAMKHKLPELLERFKEELTEEENMKNHGYHRIYGCGNLVFIKEIK